RWRTRLADLAGNSPLWDISTLGDAIVELTAAHPSGIAQLYAGRSTPLSNLVREGSALTHARRRARVVLARTDELAQRFGVAPTYVAMGVATWRSDGAAHPAEDAAAGAAGEEGAAEAGTTPAWPTRTNHRCRPRPQWGTHRCGCVRSAWACTDQRRRSTSSWIPPSRSTACWCVSCVRTGWRWMLPPSPAPPWSSTGSPPA